MAYSYFLKKFFAIQVEFVYFMWQKEYFRKRKKPIQLLLNRLFLSLKRRLPTLPLLRSTIGVTRLNFSVRNGKRWIPRAITTLMSLFKSFDFAVHPVKSSRRPSSAS